MFELLIFQDPSVSPLAKGGRRGVYDKVGRSNLSIIMNE